MKDSILKKIMCFLTLEEMIVSGKKRHERNQPSLCWPLSDSLEECHSIPGRNRITSTRPPHIGCCPPNVGCSLKIMFRDVRISSQTSNSDQANALTATKIFLKKDIEICQCWRQFLQSSRALSKKLFLLGFLLLGSRIRVSLAEEKDE